MRSVEHDAIELSEDQIARYRRDGYLPLGPVLDGGELDAMRAEEQRFRLPVAYGHPTLFVNIQLCHRSEVIRRHATLGRQVGAVRQLIGPNVCLTHQQFVTKEPDPDGATGEVPWHQDAGYGLLEPTTDVTVWVPLVDTDARNGGLFVVPGSHTNGLLPHEAASGNGLLREAVPAADPIGLELRAGEGVAFSGLLVHGSGPNRGDHTRPSFYLRYCEPRATMISEGGRPVLEDPHSWMVAGEAP